MKLVEEHLDKFRELQSRMNALVRQQPGFSGRELIGPVPGLQDDWISIFRFDSNENLQRWLHLPERAPLIDELESFLTGPIQYQIVADDTASSKTATTVFSHRVRPGMENLFHDWKRRIIEARGRFPGLLDSEMFPPVPGVQEDWIDIVRFDSSQHLHDWLRSDERRELIEESKAFTDKLEVRPLATGLENWFRLNGKIGVETTPIPPWKQASLVLLALFPIAVITHALLQPLRGHLSPPLIVLIGNIVGVSALTWLAMPRVSRAMAFWLHPSPLRKRWKVNLAGSVLVFGAVATCAAIAVSLW